MVKVSIIIPVYNSEEYLDKCLSSIRSQTLKDIEIISINDCSIDTSLEILKKHAKDDKRIRIFNNTQHKGVANARNKGLLEAKGEFIGFVDSDDWIDSNYFENLYIAAKATQSDISVANLVRVTNNKFKYYYKNKKSAIAKSPRAKFKLCAIPRSCHIVTKIYNRQKLINTGIKFEEGIYYEDIEWTHKVIFYLGQVCSVPTVNYYYLDNPLSIIGTKSDKKIKDKKYALCKSLDFIQKNNIKSSNLNWYHWSQKRSFNLFNIPILIIKSYKNEHKFYLLGLYIGSFLNMKYED